MVDREVFDKRLAKLEELLRELRRLGECEQARFLSDRALQAQAERWLHLTAECVIDLANHFIADRGLATPSTYREAFAILRREGVLSEELSAQMEKWAGLRNVLVHVYLEIDHRLLYDIMKNDLDQIADFAASLLGALPPER